MHLIIQLLAHFLFYYLLIKKNTPVKSERENNLGLLGDELPNSLDSNHNAGLLSKSLDDIQMKVEPLLD